MRSNLKLYFRWRYYLFFSLFFIFFVAPYVYLICNKFVRKAMLEDGLKGAKAGISRKDYASAYTACYNMCTQRSPFNWSEQLYERHGEVRIYRMYRGFSGPSYLYFYSTCVFLYKFIYCLSPL